MARLGGVDGVHRRDDNDHVVVAERRPADTVQLGQTRCAADGLAARPGVVPLIVGTYAAYIGATVWTDYFNVDVIRTLDGALAAEVDQLPLFERETVLREICDPAVDPAYFQHIAEIIPLLLITLGIEFGFFRATLREPAQRAATAATVTLMSIGLVCALSTLP
jgi:hypothetical protein